MNETDKIINQAADDLAAEIDFGIIADHLVDHGWVKVTLQPMTWETSDRIDLWVMKNVKGRHHTRGLVWIFENPEDATWFNLRWHGASA